MINICCCLRLKVKISESCTRNVVSNGSTGVIDYADSELINANNPPSYRGLKARVQARVKKNSRSASKRSALVHYKIKANAV